MEMAVRSRRSGCQPRTKGRVSPGTPQNRVRRMHLAPTVGRRERGNKEEGDI